MIHTKPKRLQNIIIFYPATVFTSSNGREIPPEPFQQHATLRPEIAIIVDPFPFQNSGWNKDAIRQKVSLNNLDNISVRRGTRGLHDRVLFELKGVIATGDKKHSYVAPCMYRNRYLEITPAMQYEISVSGSFPKAALDPLSEGSVFLMTGRAVHIKEPADNITNRRYSFPTDKYRNPHSI